MDEKELIKSCLSGNKKCLEQLISSIQGIVFNLSLRFLWNRPDAEDATQEILIKIITNLGKFDHRTKFSTWVYRVATNHLLNLKKTNLEKVLTSFDVFALDLQTLKGPADYDLPDRHLMEQELKTGCTLAMLQCLDRDLRITFILGSVLKLKSNVASKITGTTPENFRKRLEQSRKLIGAFLNSHCGVFNPANSCRCNKRINSALSCGKIAKGNLNFAHKVEKYNEEMEEINSQEGIYNNHGHFKSNTDLMLQLNTLIMTKAIINEPI
jgi:RNA polymerase sigma factor (sigma-70 family)